MAFRQEILWIILSDLFFIERGALSCLGQQFGLCPIVSKLTSAPFQTTAPFYELSSLNKESFNQTPSDFPWEEVDSW